MLGLTQEWRCPVLELLLTILVIALVCQLVFSFLPIDGRIVGLIILIILVMYLFGHRGLLH
jgi:hypothetical protein